MTPCSSLWPAWLAGTIDGSVLTVLALWLYAQRPSRLRSPYAEKRTT